MLCASRLSETHALRVQALSAEPGGWVAATPPACGPPLQPDTHAAASATTPNAPTQIRRATANLPAPAASQRHEARPLCGAGSRSTRPPAGLAPRNGHAWDTYPSI